MIRSLILAAAMSGLCAAPAFAEDAIGFPEKLDRDDFQAVIAARMAKASDEMSHYAEYDWVIVNHDIEESVEQVRAILCSERLKRKRQVGLGEFVKGLRAG